METQGSVSAAEAKAALVAARQSRARVAWTGYPVWYWLTTAAGLAVMPLATLLPDWLGITGVAAVAVLLTLLVVAVSRSRGVCEYWTRGAMRWQEVILLYGPTIVVLTAGALGAGLGWWPPVAAAVLGFVLFAGTALTSGARAARR